MLLWIFIYKCSCSHRFSFLLSIHLGVEWLDHMVTVCLTFWGTMLMIFIQFQSNLKLKPQTWFKSHLCPFTPCVCVYVCVWKTERERERDWGRETVGWIILPCLWSLCYCELVRTGEQRRTNLCLTALWCWRTTCPYWLLMRFWLICCCWWPSRLPRCLMLSSPFSSQNWQYTPQLLAEVPSPGDPLFIISHELTGNAYMVAMTNMMLQAPPHGPQIFFALHIFSNSFVYYSRISAKQPQHVINWGANSQSLQSPVTAGVLSSLTQGCYGLPFQMFCL